MYILIVLGRAISDQLYDKYLFLFKCFSLCLNSQVIALETLVGSKYFFYKRGEFLFSLRYYYRIGSLF